MKESGRRVIAMISIGAALALVAAVAAIPTSARAGDKDCSDFSSQRAAQIFFLKHGGPRHDPDRLDADHDGVACEDNPCPCYRKKHLPRRAELVDRRRADGGRMMRGLAAAAG